ncbi:MAG: M48 family metalloprotease [Fibromonadales bacterium]|nr:M48 family metalloprotease [Fibromonadales bacterium]
MGYIGIETRRRNNNRNAIILLAIFPLILLATLYAGCFIWGLIDFSGKRFLYAGQLFLSFFHWVIFGVIAWYIVAYFMNNRIINWSSGATPLLRRENKKVYNLAENLCISCGMKMPKIYIIEDAALNAFASGINESSYAIVLTRGIINNLEDKELEGVIAHELVHIRENDTRLSVIAIVFIGIFSFPLKLLFGAGSLTVFQLLLRFSLRSFIWLILFIPFFLVGFCLSKLVNFAISQNREYTADIGAAKLTKEPKALASALRKISGNSVLFEERGKLISQLLIEHNSLDTDFIRQHYPPQTPMIARIQGMFETHPPIEHRIWILETC